jgi:hypothetical protein
VPSLSKTAIRSAGVTKSGEPSVVTLATKSVIDFLVGPSFQLGSGSDCDLACGAHNASVTAATTA